MKKRINNKGFTLVELLAVLALLITILSIAIPSITSSVERNKEKLNNKKYDIIEAAAETYVSQYKNTINYANFTNGSKSVTEDGKTRKYGSCCINVSSIQSVGILTADDLLDANENSITGYVCYDNNNKEYVYNSSNPSSVEC